MEEEAVPRRINYLRMSITDRLANFAASIARIGRIGRNYPAEKFSAMRNLLRVAGIAAAKGIRKVRVTGGEPLVRRGVVGFLHNLHQVPAIEEVCLTTNGVLLG